MAVVHAATAATMRIWSGERSRLKFKWLSKIVFIRLGSFTQFSRLTHCVMV